jgi:ketosteroid isomerase-like protein
VGEREDIDVVRRAYASWAAGDLEGFWAAVHPETEWYPPPDSPEPGPYRGRDEIQRAIDAYLDSFDVFRPEPEEILAGAKLGTVLVLARTYVRGKGSGVEVDIPVAHLLTLRDGEVLRFEVFIDREQARTAAGLAD